MILFVDINDVFRAPMAAYWYQTISGIPAHSAGVYAQEHSCLCDAVRPQELDGYFSEQISDTMMKKADKIYCVTASVAEHLKEEYPQYKHKIYVMENIEDPIGMGRNGYAQYANDIRTRVEDLL